MRVRRLPIVVVSWLWAVVSLSAQSESGEPAYRKICQPCHGVQGQGDQAPPLVPMSREADEVLAIVREGTGQMPPISRKEISDESVVRIVEYLRALSPDKR
jgi:mono/diheme cytochrome c family protein